MHTHTHKTRSYMPSFQVYQKCPSYGILEGTAETSASVALPIKILQEVSVLSLPLGCMWHLQERVKAGFVRSEATLS